MGSPVIEIRGLRKVYKGLLGAGVEALRGVDLRVDRGQAFGLLGPNGAGKTTLVKALLGLVRPTAGDMRLMGADARTPAARRRVGYMPELRNYPRFLTAATCLDLFGRLHGMPAARRRRRTEEVLEQVELAQWRDHKVGGFSKGMKQRLALAQALLDEPEVLFLDEPAEGIDPLGRVVVRNILRGARERGTTLFMNSHLLTEVEMVCDEVAILHGGLVVESGVLSKLTSHEREYRITLAAGADQAPASLAAAAKQVPASPAAAANQVPASLAAAVRAVKPATAPAGLSAWTVTVQDREELNAALDRLRRDGVLINAVEPVRSSLEEVFLRAVGGAGGRDGRDSREEDREARPAGVESPS